jgi:SprT protein
MPEQLNTRVEDCFQQAESFFKRPFKRPVVSLKLRGQKAGVAHLHENMLRFMRGVYELPPNRCHTYDVKRRRVTRYIYKCPCADSDFPFSAQRHGLVRQGRRYLCRRCRSTLVFSGEMRVE